MQVDLAGVITDAGLQISALTAKGATIVMLPPLDVVEIGVPDNEAASALTIEMDVPVVTLGERVTFTVATTPFDRTLLFSPESRHIYAPVLAEQEIDLPAALAAGPGTAVIDTISEGEYVRVHCSPAGWLPPEEVRDKPSDALPPWVAVPDDNAKPSDWPRLLDCKPRRRPPRAAHALHLRILGSSDPVWPIGRYR